ncbi:fringe glycosyltransferase [Trichonephila clavata]|uniref:Fringe glycosyltransferase n=1 Tax=Trichonephila clavata TaxID=2740835 RepID=A0A8X6GMU5_TRICU|nr:fringe glycosyltransferase [Trichonephila clavata]
MMLLKKPLQTPYDGPYLVLKRTEKMFTIEKNGKHSTINIDRLKPAFFENSHHSSAPIISPPPVAVPTSTKPIPDSSPSSPVSPTNSTPLPYVTRFGRRTYFFSDADDAVYSSRTRGHFINTNCSSSHNRKALCCKMSVEFDAFLDSSKKWFCHFDDDNYVNVPRLVKLLQTYNPQEDWYLGKPSIRSPLEIISRYDKQKNISFWFATGGAGFCISRALALKMLPIASGGKFISIGEKIRLPDDVTMGYIIEHILQKKLTVVDLFHSHFEPMKFLKQESFVDQISFSYSRFGHEMNVLKIDGFDEKVDPTRFLSLHCHLFPNFSFCPS